jgi:hypothetical protein
METTATNRLKNNGARDPLLDAPEPSTEHSRSNPSLDTLNGSVPTAAANRNFRIPGDVIAKVARELPDDQRSAVLWAHGYCRDRDLTTAEFGAMLVQPGKNAPYSADSVYQVFTGRREADSGSIENFCRAVHALRKRVEETAPRHTTAFVHTDISKKIFETCRRAFLRKRVSFIFGESQIGKTTALSEYTRLHNHGETIMVRMPAGGGLKAFTHELALRLGLSTRIHSVDLRRRILDCFDDRKLLIVDECERCVTSERGLNALDFARDIQDMRKCGLVLAGALDFRNALKSTYALQKLARRGIAPLHLPIRPGLSALNQFAEAFGLTPAPDKSITVNIAEDDYPEIPRPLRGNPLQIQSTVIQDFGLGRWLATLEEAQDAAKTAGGHISWGRVILANALFNQEPV